MRTVGLCVYVLALAAMAAAQGAPRQIAGCVAGAPGNLTLGTVPSGDVYRLQGNTSALAGRQHQMVRLTGTQTLAAKSSQPGTFNVQRVEVLASECTATLPPQNPGEVRGEAGKAGAEQKSIDTSTTGSAGEVTPGSQTEAGAAQQPGKHKEGVEPGEDVNRAGPRGKLAPPQWGQVGQDVPAADRSADKARQAEEQPGHTLGVNAMPSYAKPGSPQGQPATQGGAGITGNAGSASSANQTTTHEIGQGSVKKGNKARHRKTKRPPEPKQQESQQ